MILDRAWRRRWLRHSPLGLAFYPDHLVRRSLLRALRRSRLEARGVMLDLGCGARPYEYIFRDFIDRSVGIDRWPATPPPEVMADGAHLPFADRAFDTVLSTEVLEHVRDPQRLLDEARRVLRPGGTLILTTPMTWGHHEEPHDYFRYTRHGLRALAAAAGLDVVALEPHGGAPRALAAIASVWLAGQSGGLSARRVLAQPLCIAVQLVGRLLDGLDRARWISLGHLLIARRPQE